MLDFVTVPMDYGLVECRFYSSGKSPATIIGMLDMEANCEILTPSNFQRGENETK